MKDIRRDADSNISIFFRPLLKGGLLGLAVILILFVLLALILASGIIPLSACPAIACIAIAIGAFLAGLSTAKSTGKNGLIIGALCGFVLFLIFTIIGMAAFASTPGVSTIIRLIIFVTASAIGGIVGVGSADKRRIV